MKNIYFDPDGKVSYGYYRCPECNSSFYSGGPPLHENQKCSHLGYDQLDYHFSLPEVIGLIHRSKQSTLVKRNSAPFLSRVEAQYPEIYARAHAIADAPTSTKGATTS